MNPDELRLLFAIALNVAVFISTYALARRVGSTGRLQAACDACLFSPVVQYLSVALPGMVGCQNAVTMTLVAGFLCLFCWWIARSKQTTPQIPLTTLARGDSLGLVACALFVVGFVLAYAYDQCWLPPLSTDPLVYHLPTAVQWMQTGRLGLFDTWYWNPAATYSPATSSTFMAWLMVPVKNDVLVRYLQVGPLLMIFLLVARLCRLMGCNRSLAGIIALSAALCRPFFSQAMFPKDDLIVTAFFGAAVVALASENLRDKLGPWRLGIAIGMVLASKYTILLVCPLFLFLIDAPFRSRWRLSAWIKAITIAAALSLPWYARTTWLTGNPLYPVDVKLLGVHLFKGMFTTERDLQLRTVSGVWNMLATSYHSLPAILLIAVLIGWLAALMGAGRSSWRHPIQRACLIASPLTLILFVIVSPHHEVRYLFPLFLLFFAATAYAIHRWIASSTVQIMIASALAIASLLTCFEMRLLDRVGWFAFEAMVFTAVGMGCVLAMRTLAARSPQTVPRFVNGSLTFAMLAGFLLIYVYWSAYLRMYREGVNVIWEIKYPEQAPLWRYVREEVPVGDTVAFANTSFVYPLYGFDYTRRVGYAPVRKSLTRFVDMPRLGDAVPGDFIVDYMTAAQNTDADLDTWLHNLDRMGARYLLIHANERGIDPPEARLARQNPQRFEEVFRDKNGVIYRINSRPE